MADLGLHNPPSTRRRPLNKLLQQFAALFSGQPYLHRKSTQGDRVASFLYEDLHALTLPKQPSLKYPTRVLAGDVVINEANRVVGGRRVRRGDGTFGSLVPGQIAVPQPPFIVSRGPVAEFQIGAEIKIVATKQKAQQDRVATAMVDQAAVFRGQNADMIRVAILAVNHAPTYEGYEGTRTFLAKVPPSREAPAVTNWIVNRVQSEYDELIVLPFVATNMAPFAFAWFNQAQTTADYNAALARIASRYERRF